MATAAPQRRTTLGALYNGPRELGWRRLDGSVNYSDQPGITVTDAFASQGLDFQVETSPMYTINGVGQQVAVPGKNAILRSGTPMIYGTTGGDYRPLQNADIARLLDPLTERWSIDAIVSSHEGRDLMIAFKTEEAEVNGEPLQEYFWSHTSHDGLRGVRFMLVPVRLFCTNQLITGMKRASFQASVDHKASASAEIGFQLNIFQQLEGARRQLHRNFTEMGKKKLTQDEITELLNRIYPEPKMPKRVEMLHLLAGAVVEAGGELDDSFRDAFEEDQLALTDEAHDNYERAIETTKIVRSDARTLLEKFNDEHPNLAMSGWSFYNSVVELADFRGGNKFVNSVAQSALLGARAQEKERAFAGVMSIVEPGWTNTASSGLDPEVTSAQREARAKARALAAEARTAKAQEVAAERYAKQVEEGKIKPRLAPDGVTVLPPLTPEELAAERAEKENEAIAKLEAALEARRQKQTENIRLAQDRLSRRSSESAARAIARLNALTERDAAEAAFATEDTEDTEDTGSDSPATPTRKR